MLVHFPLLVVECGILHFFSSGWRRPPGGGDEYNGGVWLDTSVISRPAPVPDRGGCTVAGSTSASVGCQSGPVRFQLAEQSTGGDLLVVAMIWWSLDVFTCSGSRSGWSHRRRFLIDVGGAISLAFRFQHALGYQTGLVWFQHALDYQSGLRVSACPTISLAFWFQHV